MKYFILLGFISLSFFNSFCQDSEWKLVKDKNNIKVYTRTPEGTKIKEFKAITVINASVTSIENEIRNVKSHKDWIKDILNPELLKTVNSNEFYTYYELKIPFPFENRDMVLHVLCKNENGVFTMIEETASKYAPEKSGIVRMPISKGKWVLTPTKDGKTNVHYQFLGDPAGSIPAWITNMFVVDGPYETLMNLKERVE